MFLLQQDLYLLPILLHIKTPFVTTGLIYHPHQTLVVISRLVELFWAFALYTFIYLLYGLFLIEIRFSRPYFSLGVVMLPNSQKKSSVRIWPLVFFPFPSSLSLSNFFRSTSFLLPLLPKLSTNWNSWYII